MVELVVSTYQTKPLVRISLLNFLHLRKMYYSKSRNLVCMLGMCSCFSENF